MNDGIYVDEYMLSVSGVLTWLKSKGIFDSINSVPNKNGEAIPMLTISAIDFLESYDFSQYSIIEFGSGQSTVYFSKNFSNVVSFENNEDFFDKLKNKLNNNVTYNFISNDDLLKNNYKININDKTIILVDCSANRNIVIHNIFKNGMPNIVILDNSEFYPNSCKYIVSNGYMEIPFWGLRPSEVYNSCTSVFIKNNFVLPEKKYPVEPGYSEKITDNKWDLY
jgi:hypothetical protein